MAQPCASTTTRTPCCRNGGVPCNGEKVAAVAGGEIDALIGRPDVGPKARMDVPASADAPATEAGCSCRSRAGAAPAAPPPALSSLPASNAVNNSGLVYVSVSSGKRPKTGSVGIAVDSRGAPHASLEPPEAVRTTMTATIGPVEPPALAKLTSSKKRSASAVAGSSVADGGSGRHRAVTGMVNRVALSPKPGIVAMATAPASTGVMAAATSPPASRPKRSRRIVGRDPMPREQRVYFTCATCGYDRNHIRKRTCNNCRAPKIAMPSGSAVEAARSERQAASAELQWGVAGTTRAEMCDGGGAIGSSRGSLPNLAPATMGGSEAGGQLVGGKGNAAWHSRLLPLGGHPPTSMGASHADHHGHLQLKHE